MSKPMTSKQIANARRRFRLTLGEFADLLGYEGAQARSQMHHLETGRRDLRPAQRRLIQAYLDGYRPEDWPGEIEEQ